MAKLGSKKLSQSVKKSLQRNKKREVRPRVAQGTILEKYQSLVDSFTKEDYLAYEKLHHQWGTPGRKRQVMLDVAVKNNIQGPVRELTEIRVNDLLAHQKILQVLRYHWLNREEHYKDQVNNDPNRYWEVSARVLLRSKKERGIHISKTWEGEDNVEELTSFLKKLYNKQNGKCAITGIPLELQFGVGRPLPNKCSLDRIDSSRGYNHRNVWMVCWWVNQMKMDMTMAEFKERAKILSTSFDNNSNL